MHEVLLECSQPCEVPTHSAHAWFTTQTDDEPNGLRLELRIGLWLLESEEWHRWRTGKPNTVLNIIGGKGTGKTSVFRFLAEELSPQSIHPTTVVTHRFQSCDKSVGNSGQRLLARILTTLYTARHITSEARSLLEEYAQNLPGGVWNQSLKTLQHILTKVLDTDHGLILIIDGFDLCTDQDELFVFFVQQSQRGSVSLILTSSKPVAQPTKVGVVTLDLEAYSHERVLDVSRFIYNEIHKIRHLSKAAFSTLRTKAVTVATRCSTDNFLIAECFIRLIKAQNTPAQLEDKLAYAPFEGALDMLRDLWMASNDQLATNPRSRRRRDWTLRLILVAEEPLTLSLIEQLLAMDAESGLLVSNEQSFDIEVEIRTSLGSFINISPASRVTFFHYSVGAFVGSQDGISVDDSHTYLARLCLAVLSNDRTRDYRRGRDLLQDHLGPGDVSGPCRSEDPLYRYAALYFQVHVTALKNPPTDILHKLIQFLQGTEFVTWSETVPDLCPGTSYATQIKTRISLVDWASRLEESDRAALHLEQFFEGPYNLIASIIHDKESDRILQFLPRIRLGAWFTATGRTKSELMKGVEQKKIVFEGLAAILPPRNPFLLRQKAMLLQEEVWQRPYSESLPKLEELHEQQQGVSTQDDLNVTAWLIAAVLMGLNHYQEADLLISRTLEEVRQGHSERFRFFNLLLMLRGMALERLNKLDLAAAVFQAALSTMIDVAGEDNIFVLSLKTALGGVLRKQGQFEKAASLLIAGWAGREIVLTQSAAIVVDAALQAALNHRDQGRYSDCLEILEAIGDSSVFDEDFERKCSLQHVRALVWLHRGQYVQARNMLLDLIHQASGESRANNNRDLLWTRLDLAGVMRNHGEPKEAEMLFADLVTSSKESEVTGEPESPSQLRIAEQALSLVRLAKIQESQALLAIHDLRWVREADFWFTVQGGPILDTSIIAPIETEN